MYATLLRSKIGSRLISDCYYSNYMHTYSSFNLGDYALLQEVHIRRCMQKFRRLRWLYLKFTGSTYADACRSFVNYAYGHTFFEESLWLYTDSPEHRILDMPHSFRLALLDGVSFWSDVELPPNLREEFRRCNRLANWTWCSCRCKDKPMPKHYAPWRKSTIPLHLWFPYLHLASSPLNLMGTLLWFQKQSPNPCGQIRVLWPRSPNIFKFS